MISYDLTEWEGVSLYDSLYRHIRDDILSGRIKAGERLPSKRALAQELGVSVITVENAYQQLLSEGYVYSIERSGFYAEKVERAIRTGKAGKTEQTKRTKSAERLPSSPSSSSSLPAPQAEVAEDNEENEENEDNAPSPGKADFTLNRADGERFPFSVWAKLMRETLLEDRDKLLKPAPHAGALPLQRAIADFVRRNKGIDASPEQIVVGAGTEYLCSLIVQLFSRERVFGVEDPGYAKTASVYLANGAKVVYLPLDQCGVSMKAVSESEAQILHLTPTHHYPTGIITPIRRRQELLSWAYGGADRYIIEDDYDSEFRFSGRPIPTLRSMDREKVIYVNTFSKTLTPSIRISYMILPDALLALYGRKLGFYSCAVPLFEQYTLARFLERGYFERHISRMRTFYKARRNKILSSLDGLSCRDKLSVLAADTGLHLVIGAKTELSDEEILSRAEALGVRLACLSGYSVLHEKRYEKHFLINYSDEGYDDFSFLDEIFADD